MLIDEGLLVIGFPIMPQIAAAAIAALETDFWLLAVECKLGYDQYWLVAIVAAGWKNSNLGLTVGMSVALLERYSSSHWQRVRLTALSSLSYQKST